MKPMKLRRSWIVYLTGATLLTALAGSTVRAQSLQAPLSGEACRLLIDSAKAEYEQEWQAQWRQSALPELSSALKRFVTALSDEDRRILQWYRAGKVSHRMAARIFMAHIETLAQPGIEYSLMRGPEGVVLKTHFRPATSTMGPAPRHDDVLFTPLQSLDGTASGADTLVVRELAARVSLALRLPAGQVAHNADEYVRKRGEISEECFWKGLLTSAESESEDKLALAGPTLPVPPPADAAPMVTGEAAL